MTWRDYLARIEHLEHERVPYALATVVVRRAPVSAHLGDRAIVLADGRMDGFVGGSCSRDIVRRQALEAIRTGQPRLLRIRPARMNEPGGDETEGAIVIPMSCASEGAIDVYVEPHLPARLLLICGHTPVADELAKLAVCLGAYRVIRIVAADEVLDLQRGGAPEAMAVGELPAYLESLGAAESARSIAVVASQGHYDEAALEALLGVGSRPAFVGLLASRKRAATVFGVLAQDGIAADAIACVRNPVGLDIGARSPGDVAVSVLAQIVQESAEPPQAAPYEPEPAETAVDPVCGMDVDRTGAAHRAQYGDTAYYFCCAHCRSTFAADPARYAGAAARP